MIAARVNVRLLLQQLQVVLVVQKICIPHHLTLVTILVVMIAMHIVLSLDLLVLVKYSQDMVTLLTIALVLIHILALLDIQKVEQHVISMLMQLVNLTYYK